MFSLFLGLVGFTCAVPWLVRARIYPFWRYERYKSAPQQAQCDLSADFYDKWAWWELYERWIARERARLMWETRPFFTPPGVGPVLTTTSEELTAAWARDYAREHGIYVDGFFDVQVKNVPIDIKKRLLFATAPRHTSHHNASHH